MLKAKRGMLLSENHSAAAIGKSAGEWLYLQRRHRGGIHAVETG